jgi:hypothetical protein
MSDHLPCLARRELRRALDELRLRTDDGRQRRAGAATNISIQIRYCTATVADKPFREMRNLIVVCGFGILLSAEMLANPGRLSRPGQDGIG